MSGRRWLLVGLVAILSLALIPSRWSHMRDAQQAANLRDFGVFYDSAVAYASGTSPYDPDAGLAPNLLPPHALVAVFVPATWLDRDVAGVAWLALSALALLVSIGIVVRELAIPWTWPHALAGAVMLGSSGLFVGTATSGNLYLVLTPVITAAWVCWRRGAMGWAAVLLGLAASAKVLLLVGAGWLGLTGRLTPALLLGATTALVAALGVAVLTPEVYGDWLGILARAPIDGHYHGASILQAFTRLTSPSRGFAPMITAPLETVRLAWVIVAALVFTVAVVRAPQSPDRGFLVCLTTSVLVSPLGWNGTLWWTVGPVAAIALSDRTWRPILIAIGLMLWLIPETGPRWGQPWPLGTVTLGMLYPAIMGTLWACGLFSGRSVSSTSSRHPHGAC